MTSKDTSKKIRSILRNKKEQGKFIGSKPCYGYMRDPLDKGHLIPNPEVAPVVKKIFNMAYSGTGISDIVSYLNDNNIKCPSAYKGTKLSVRQKCNQWTISSVNKILKNRMYTGDMVQNVQTKLSYKSQKKVSLEKEFWIIVENTHEPLVSKTIFEAIQNAPARVRTTHCNIPLVEKHHERTTKKPYGKPICTKIHENGIDRGSQTRGQKKMNRIVGSQVEQRYTHKHTRYTVLPKYLFVWQFAK